jgi:hypothetical protein
VSTVVTNVVRLRCLGVSNTNEGSADIGVCVVDLVVVGKGNGSVPMTVGYVPFQKVLVVDTLGGGKENVYCVLPYDTT